MGWDRECGEEGGERKEGVGRGQRWKEERGEVERNKALVTYRQTALHQELSDKILQTRITESETVVHPALPTILRVLPYLSAPLISNT